MRPGAGLAGAGASEGGTPPRTDAPARHSRGPVLGGIVTATVFGLLLRIVMAQGDLWLDEAWSLKLVAGLSSPWAVFWKISHDNNHFLNSLWLSCLGPEAPPWAYRTPSVVFGTLAIPVAGGIGWKRGRVGAVVAAWFVAVSMPLVVYGSEARGYAGLVLAALVAVATIEPALDDAMAGKPPGRAAWGLGMAIGFGTLCHLTMLATPTVLSLAAIMRLRNAGPSLRTCLGRTMTLFGPSLVCLLPAVAAVTAGFLYRGTFECGGVVLFTGSNFAAGFGGMLRAVLGLWDGLPMSFVFLGSGLLILTTYTAEGTDVLLRWLGTAAVVVLPAGMAALRFPNMQFPRYFLVPGLVILLIEADLVGRLWDRASPGSRVVAVALLCATTAGQAAADLSALAVGRGASREAVSIMTREGRPSYSSDSRFRSETVAELAARRQAITLTYVPADRFCSDRPDWYVVTDPEAAAPPALTIGQASCAVSFAKRATFPASALSGMRWVLYRRSA